MTTRRVLLAAGVAGLAATAAARLGATRSRVAGSFAVSHTDAEWRKMLSPEAYVVLREDGTEWAYTSPLLHETRAGTFACAGCDLPAFSSATKYDSRTGWPSFWQPVDGAVATSNDTTFGMARTEVHCARCGGHLGHVFSDGPQPTGQRYCMNGVALGFHPDAA